MRNKTFFAVFRFTVVLCALVGLSASAFAEPGGFSWSDGVERLISKCGFAPRVCRLSDGRILAGIETSEGIQTLASADRGETWTEPVQASFWPDKRCANVNFYREGQNLYLAYRAVKRGAKELYTSLQVSVSRDEGRSWKHHSTVAEYREPRGGVWEPCLGTLNGKLVCFYANDAASVMKSGFQNIEYKVWDGEQWTGRTVVSDGNRHRSRDGMPVWTRLSSGVYVCVIESTHCASEGFPFVICSIYSEDGKNWSEPVEIFRPGTLNSKAGAPGIAELPDGRLAVSFQTDEDSAAKGDPNSVMKTIVSDGSDVKTLTRSSFGPAESVFGAVSIWTGITCFDGVLYAAAGMHSGAKMKFIEVF
ncbi:MAG: exo-alpha-sialidase [Thermoguttaceae bacterium]|nr:exo-alpha-sialidase [Thermoguttaceae bacterium]